MYGTYVNHINKKCTFHYVMYKCMKNIHSHAFIEQCKNYFHTKYAVTTDYLTIMAQYDRFAFIIQEKRIVFD